VREVVGIGDAPDQATTGKLHASENAFEGSNNVGQRIDNASKKGYEPADDTTLKGSGNRGDVSHNREENADERSADAAEDSIQGLTQASERAPTGTPLATKR
jgi:hypothetical protein